MGSGRHAGKALCPGRGCTTGRTPKLCLGDTRAGMGLPWEQMPPDSCKMFSGFETLRKCFNQVAEGGRNSYCSGAKSWLEPGLGMGMGTGMGMRTGSGCPVEEGRERLGPACGTPGRPAQQRQAAAPESPGSRDLQGRAELGWSKLV